MCCLHWGFCPHGILIQISKRNVSGIVSFSSTSSPRPATARRTVDCEHVAHGQQGIVLCWVTGHHPGAQS
jgi:hypothetical protein